MEKRIENTLALTQSQLQIWAGQMLNPNTPLHNTVHALEIGGKIAEATFQTSVQQLVNKVDALRLNFNEKNGIPYQTIVKSLLFKAEIIDGTNLSQQEIDDLIYDRSQKILDLSTRAFDIALIKINPEKCICFLNMHHLITDAVSATLVFKYLSNIYQANKQIVSDDKAGYPTFKSYLEFENEEFRDTENDHIKAYWKEKIETVPRLPKLYAANATHKLSLIHI